MKPGECAQCGAEFEGPGIIHRGRFFCSDECCESWEDECARNGEPEPDRVTDASAIAPQRHTGQMADGRGGL